MKNMKSKNLVKITALVGFFCSIVTGIIITAYHLEKTEGSVFPVFVFGATIGALIASIIKYLADKRRNNTTTSRLVFIGGLCAIVGLLIGTGIGYHYFQQPLKVEQEEIVKEAVGLVAESGKIPYRCPLKVLESNLVIEWGESERSPFNIGMWR